MFHRFAQKIMTKKIVLMETFLEKYLSFKINNRDIKKL